MDHTNLLGIANTAINMQNKTMDMLYEKHCISQDRVNINSTNYYSDCFALRK